MDGSEIHRMVWDYIIRIGEDREGGEGGWWDEVGGLVINVLYNVSNNIQWAIQRKKLTAADVCEPLITVKKIIVFKSGKN